MPDLEALKTDLVGLKMTEDAQTLAKKSRDFYWYSPILKRQLDAVVGDLLVTPKNEAEVIRILAACHAREIPVTVRGGGTGNYGQAMPLSGGVILDMAEMNAIKEIKAGDQGQQTVADMARLAAALAERGADAIIAGCTEIPLVLGDNDVSVPLVSSTDALALKTVMLATGAEALPQAQ